MRLLFFTTVLLLFSVSLAMACSCFPPNDKLAAEAFEDADIVMKAKIINPSKGFTQAGPLLTVEPIEVYKGRDIPDLINMNYNNNAAACGHDFKGGEVVIIGVYDTRQLSLQNTNTRGYGFRMMSSCQQNNVRLHVNNMKDVQDVLETININITE